MDITTEAKRRPNVGASVLEHPALPAVLAKLNMAEPGGGIRQVDIADEGLGLGPILDPAVIEKFGELDTTRSLSHLEWMLNQAGGGAKAMADSKEKYDLCKSLFVRERMEGHGERSTKIAPMTREQAEAAWAAEDQVFRNAFFPADQDMLLQNHGSVFGFHRYWPGMDSRYEKIYEAVKAFRDNMVSREGNQSKVSFINQAREQEARAAGAEYVPVETDLTQYRSLQALETANDGFKYFFKRRTASKDIQFIGKHPEKGYLRASDAKFYEDGNVVAFIPATAAAAMKTGFNNWCVANKTEFETAFLADPQKRQTPRWTEYTQAGPLLFMVLKGDVNEPAYPPGHKYHEALRKIAAHVKSDLCDIGSLREPYPGVQFFDKINRNSPSPMDWEEVIGRVSGLPNGDTVVASLRAAMNEFIIWVQQMKEDEIKSSVYERLAGVLVYNMLYS